MLKKVLLFGRGLGRALLRVGGHGILEIGCRGTNGVYGLVEVIQSRGGGPAEE